MSLNDGDLKLSIVTIAHQINDDLLRCINSCFFKNITYEHIIVLPKGTKFKKNFSQFHSKIKIINDIGKGVYPAINVGLKKVRGNHILILHGDNYLTKNAEIIIKNVVCNSSKTIQFGCFYERKNGLKGKFLNLRNTFFNILLGIYPPHPGLILSKNNLKELGFLSENYKICSDFIHYIKLLKIKEGMNYINEPIVVSPQGGTSTSGFISVKKIISERTKILNENFINLGYFYFLPIFIGYLVKLIHRFFSKFKEFH